MRTDDLTVKEYQKLVIRKLRTALKLPVKKEWCAMKEHPTMYSPRVDIAVGPFVYDAGSIADQHDLAVAQWEKPIRTMLDYHKQNIKKLKWDTVPTSFDELCYKNKAARCFLAIEIENGVNPKYLTGDILNAMALGRLGVVVPFTYDTQKSFARIRKYIWYLSAATNLDTRNLLILDKQQLTDSFML